MAERNPARNIEKLRLESGADEVISSGPFTQSEPITSYKLGNSSMSVALTSIDWPINGTGIVNTSRVNATVGSQTFSPKGSTDTYMRSWNDLPPVLSDNFTGESSYDAAKWRVDYQVIAGSVTQTGGELVLYRPNYDYGGGNIQVQSKFGFIGDFDIEIKNVSHAHSSPSGTLWVSMQLASGAGLHLSTNTYINTYRNQQNNNLVAYIGGSQKSTVNLPSLPLWFRYVRIAGNAYFYYKTIVNGGWILHSSGTISTANLLFNIRLEPNSGNATVKFDDFVINSGTPYLFSGASSIWQPWVIVKSAVDILADSQSAADSAVSGHTSAGHNAITGTFTSNDGKTVTVTNGIITSIV